MNELDRLQDAFLKADQRAQAGDQQAAQDARMFAQEIKRIQAGGGVQRPAQEGFMGQVNRGIADTVGGVVDFINPFDNEVWQGTPVGMGSAQDALASGMRGIGAMVADEAPATITGAVGRGVGQAAGSLPTIVAGLAGLARQGGAIGAAAAEALKSLTTKGGVALEAVAGGLSEGAAEVVEQGGGGELAQNVARIAAPLSIPATGAAVRGAASVAERTPIAGAVMRAGRDAVRAIAPASEAGARRGAQQRLEELTGSPARLRELSEGINPNDPLGRTPAQQTGDPNLLGLERAAAAEQPLIRESLAARAAGTRQAAEGQLREGTGPVADARNYFDTRLTEFRTNLTERADRAIAEATRGAVPESEVSTRMVGRLKAELDNALLEERAKWNAVPKEELVSTSNTAGTAARLIDETPWAQRRDIPQDLREAFGENGALGEATTVAQLHGLYSEMRRVARSAMAGNDQNKNRARIANEVAEAILEDLGAIDATTPAGRLINDARAFSRTLHETFDQGDVGEILKRTIDGDNTMTPETALGRTVGRGGAGGMVAARNIEEAAPRASQDVQNYLRGRFSTAITDADGTFSAKRAATWMRDNRETLARYPELRAQFTRALSSKSNAEQFIARAEASALARFNTGQDGEAVKAIFGADNPAQAARSIVATARRDPSGAALAGVKGAVSDFLIGKAGGADGLSGTKLNALLQDQQVMAALRQIYDGRELVRIRRVARALAKADVPAREIGAVLDSPANKALEMVARYLAVQASAGKGNSAGASLQIANMASGRAKEMLTRLTNDRARQLLLDAVEDPQLFKDIAEGVFTSPKVQRSLAPYLAGGAATVKTQEERRPMRIELTDPGNQSRQ